MYQISWLESAIVELRKSNKIDVVNGDMTIEEFIKAFQDKELEKVIKLS
jgi:hypothetical protein